MLLTSGFDYAFVFFFFFWGGGWECFFVCCFFVVSNGSNLRLYHTAEAFSMDSMGFQRSCLCSSAPTKMPFLRPGFYLFCFSIDFLFSNLLKHMLVWFASLVSLSVFPYEAKLEQTNVLNICLF